MQQNTQMIQRAGRSSCLSLHSEEEQLRSAHSSPDAVVVNWSGVDWQRRSLAEHRGTKRCSRRTWAVRPAASRSPRICHGLTGHTHNPAKSALVRSLIALSEQVLPAFYLWMSDFLNSMRWNHVSASQRAAGDCALMSHTICETNLEGCCMWSGANTRGSTNRWTRAPHSG